jgi:hypothetical protein
MSDLAISDLLLPTPNAVSSAGPTDSVTIAEDGTVSDSFLQLLDNKLAVLNGLGQVGRGGDAPVVKADALLYRPGQTVSLLPADPGAVSVLVAVPATEVVEVLPTLPILEGSVAPLETSVAELLVATVPPSDVFGAPGIDAGTDDITAIPGPDAQADNKDLSDDVVLASLLPVQILPFVQTPIKSPAQLLAGQKIPTLPSTPVPQPLDAAASGEAGILPEGGLAKNPEVVLPEGEESAALQVPDGQLDRVKPSKADSAQGDISADPDSVASDETWRASLTQKNTPAQEVRLISSDSQSLAPAIVAPSPTPGHQQFQPLSFFAAPIALNDSGLSADAGGDDLSQKSSGGWLANFDLTSLAAKNGDSASQTGFQSVLTSIRAGGVISPAGEQVLMYIRQLANQKQTQLNVQLNPAELGKINIRLEFAEGGKVRARVLADRPETLDLLQNDRHGLEQALAAAGLDLDAGNMEFSLQQGQGNPEDRGPDTGGAAQRVAALSNNASLESEQQPAAGQIDLAAGVVNIKI